MNKKKQHQFGGLSSEQLLLSSFLASYPSLYFLTLLSYLGQSVSLAYQLWTSIIQMITTKYTAFVANSYPTFRLWPKGESHIGLECLSLWENILNYLKIDYKQRRKPKNATVFLHYTGSSSIVDQASPRNLVSVCVA